MRTGVESKEGEGTNVTVTFPPERAIADFEGLWPDRPVVKLPGVGHYCQEDVPEKLVEQIKAA